MKKGLGYVVFVVNKRYSKIICDDMCLEMVTRWETVLKWFGQCVDSNNNSLVFYTFFFFVCVNDAHNK